MLDEEVRELLHRHSIRLNTDVGQHFLIEENILQQIVAAAELKPGECVLEIGPGIGVLTRELLKQNAHVEAIEIDPRMIPLLHEFCGEHVNLTVTQGNALHIPTPTESPYKVVANIPYHITSPLLTHLLYEAELRPVSLTLLIQKEVAENICNTTTQSLLTVLVHLFGEPHMICSVPRNAFLPPPAVESAVIHITCFREPLVPHTVVSSILKLVKHAMSQRRKMLRSTVGSLPGGTEALAAANIDASRRPQTLTIHEWIALEHVLSSVR